MKKLLSILLAVLMLLTILAVPVYAEGPMKFELVITSGPYDHGTDETLTVEIRVSNNQPGHLGGNIYIDIPDGLVLNGTPKKAVEEGKVVEENDMFVVGYAEDGPARLAIGYAVADPECIFNTDGVVATISFKVAEGATIADSDFGLVLDFKQVKGPDKEYRNTDPDIGEHVIFPTSPTEVEMGICSHPDVEKVGGQEATCTEPGYSAGEKCKFCGEPIGDTQQIPALGHDWKLKEHKEEATCTKEGTDVYECSRCQETEERKTEKAPHVESKDYKSDGTNHWYYCVNCDAVIGEKEAHKPDSEWHNEDVSVDGHYHICTVCKAVTGTEKHVDEDLDGACDVCEASLHEHIADDSKWLSDGEYHYHACKTVEGCTAKLDMTAHIPDTEWHTEAGSAEHWHICTVCGAKIDSTVAKHTYGEYTSTGATEHSHSCTACGAVETAKHNGGEATCTKQAKCADCGEEYGELDKTNHADGVDEKVWESDGTNHWHVCKYCEAKVGTEAHKGGTATCSKQAVCEVCKAEYGELDKNNHDGVDEKVWESDGTNHWHVCANCGEITGVEAHKGGTATCSKQAVCEVCKAEYGELDKNNHDGVDETVWKSDGKNHWHVCANCGEITGTAAHTYTAGEYEHDADGHWQVCTVCKAETEHEEHVKGDMTQDESGHWYKCASCDEKLEFDAHTKATLTAAVEPYKDDNGVKHDGSLAYWHCPDCGKYFLDDNGKKVGVFDDISSFTVKYQDDCDDLGHTLTVISSNALSHTYMCTRECGFFWTEAHIFNEYGFCSKCGYKIPGFEETKPEDNVEVDSPTEGTEQGGDTEGDEMNADDTDNTADTPAEAPAESEPAPAPAPAETNPETGLAMSVIPAILAAAALVVKRR